MVIARNQRTAIWCLVADVDLPNIAPWIAKRMIFLIIKMTASGLGISKKWCRRSRNSIPTGTGEKISLKPRVNILHERQNLSVALINHEIKIKFKIIYYQNLSLFKQKHEYHFTIFWGKVSASMFWIFSRNDSNLSWDISKTFMTKVKKPNSLLTFLLNNGKIFTPSSWSILWDEQSFALGGSQIQTSERYLAKRLHPT